MNIAEIILQGLSTIILNFSNEVAMHLGYIELEKVCIPKS